MLPFHFSGIGIDYDQGGAALVKGAPNAIGQSFPYKLNNGKVCCGSSIHPVTLLGAGTFGALVQDSDENLYGLSNNHVTGMCNSAPPGFPILCPGPLDASEEHLSPFTIGRHSRLLPINDGIPENVDISTNWDAAVFDIEDQQRVCSMQGDRYDTPEQVAEPVPGMRVEKFGRTTGFTAGTIRVETASPIPVSYNVREMGISKKVFFEKAFLVEGDNAQPFSAAGDSGSLVVGYDQEGNRLAVGIVFAGDGRNRSFILSLPVILQKLGVSLVSGHNL
ncbi:MAG: hypothetical protein U9P68_11745 [Pseudomonadota bacterium]|nr:hypothetical protein [Pseudomonadota bacterium]